jgi:hypothetical protein
MPGFLGGSSGSSGAGGEISFPKEFIDPVTKLRISQPENLIDTDFEYGLQPTKWETVELINNTPSFFSKSGDTTIPGIRAITTNAGTREITVTTDFDHLLSVGIPISVTGTKSVTADGAYIINSIPNSTTFTYLCKANQATTASIEDLYSSIITGEFFQGSQLRIADGDGILTNDSATSTLTVTTASSHGFKVNTPFYFLNLNSTISQEFPATNTTAKSFDATNSATAQTFDGSNTLSSINVDWSNSATIGGVTSNISSVSIPANTITVSHGTENFSGKVLGTPLYYSLTGGSGYFATNPRGVVFLKTVGTLGTSTSTFQVSAVPDGDVIPITGALSGTFQLANQARTFAGNNENDLTQTTLTILKGDAKVFDATNSADAAVTVSSVSGSNVTVTSETELLWYTGAMVFYSTTGSAYTGLTDDTTYFVDSFFRQGSSTSYTFTLKPLPNGSVITSLSGGTGTHTFQKIGISLDKNIFHVKDNGFLDLDMLQYEYPEGGRFSVGDASEIKDFYFVQTRYDAHNFTLNQTTGDLSPLTVATTVDRGTTITPTTATPIGLTLPLTFAVTSGVLPNGLSLNTTTGSISGTPVEAIASPGRVVIITATDSGGATAFQTHTFIINATVGAINPSTVSRENIFASQAMTAITFTTTNLVAPITWAISSGTLPTGLSFNTSNGSITGTPTETIAAPGRQVIVRATDTGGLQGFSTITFQINPAPELYAFTSATFTSGGAQGRFGPSLAQMRSGVGSPSWASTYLNQGRANGYQLWTVPRTGTYEITAAGARGQQSSNNQGTPLGAVMRGRVSLTQGSTLEMVIGQLPNGGTNVADSNAGGGGGTFVAVGGTNTPVIVAGGGGGSYSTWGGQQFHSGQTRRRPIWSGSLAPASSNDGVNPADGQGGPGYHGGGGGGFFSGGQVYSGRSLSESAGTGDGNQHQYTQGAGFTGNNIFGTFYAIGGNSNSGTNTLGGFGGGGGGHTGNNTGGGGGGYSGGPGGYTSGGGNINSGIGGGSFIISSATNVGTSDAQYEGSGTFNGSGIANIGYNNGTGYVTIVRI